MILLQLILVKGTLSIAYVPKRSKLSFHYIFFFHFGTRNYCSARQLWIILKSFSFVVFPRHNIFLSHRSVCRDDSRFL